MESMDRPRITIFDTTLRDGEQSPGCSMNVQEKLRLAQQLDRLGVDVIEAGFPIASDGDFEAVQSIAASLRRPIIAGLARACTGDVDRAWQALQGAAHPRVHVFLATSDIHLKYKLRITREKCLEQARDAVRHAKSLCPDVEFSPEDATRTDVAFLCQVVEAAIAAGATTVNIPDTVGYSMPEEYGNLIRTLREKVAGIDKVTISTHCHNDLGLAVANSLAGLQAGARQDEVCINGLGARAGTAPPEEVGVALQIRAAQFPGLESGVRTEELARTSRLVSRLTGYPVQYNKAVVGRNAFAHESGIHQHGVLADRNTYEIIDAASVGQKGSQIVLGKHSGRHAFSDTLSKMGITIQGDALNSAFARFKELADRKVELTDADLEAIVAEELGTSVEAAFSLEELEVAGGTVGVPRARVVLVRGGEKAEASADGDGMIDAD